MDTIPDSSSKCFGFTHAKASNPLVSKLLLIVNLSHKDKVLETFGMTILEGMYFGLPAIVPTQGGVEELVENGVNGYKIDYTELEKIAEVIGEISSNVELWEKLSQGACQKANDFSRDRFNKRLEEVLVSA
ncbi:MAG: glycosyltransferase [Algoriphagus aquaeductus]|uniref:glycosyltransferase n=1 Tax=Algoriphagus aquaeductus TaxID=475299 RepID=UPI0038797359